MIRHMRHGSPPRLMALQSILSPNRRESLPTPSAGVRMSGSKAGMARPYSQDLRDRVIEATGNGKSARQAAVRFDVGVSTAIKWVERLRDSGERSARRQGRRPGSKLDAHRDFLLAVIEAAPDATIEELRRRLVEEKGVRAST